MRILTGRFVVGIVVVVDLLALNDAVDCVAAEANEHCETAATQC